MNIRFQIVYPTEIIGNERITLLRFMYIFKNRPFRYLQSVPEPRLHLIPRGALQ